MCSDCPNIAVNTNLNLVSIILLLTAFPRKSNSVLTLYPDIIKIIVAVILPPLGVFLEVGCSGAFFLNIILTILGYIPGIIHALYIILTR
ncbi:hypothetical protein OXX80_000172 [Metschnikowia pulcherrima]